MWLNTRQNVESHFPNKWMNGNRTKNSAVNSPPSHTLYTLTHSRDYLFIRTLFTVLMCWLYQLSHSNAPLFFSLSHSHNRHLHFNEYITVRLYHLVPDDMIAVTPLSVVAVVRFLFFSFVAFELTFSTLVTAQINNQFEFRFVKMDFNAGNACFSTSKRENNCTHTDTHAPREWKSISSCQREPPMPTYIVKMQFANGIDGNLCAIHVSVISLVGCSATISLPGNCIEIKMH